MNLCQCKYHYLSQKLAWRLAGVTAFTFLLLGSISFGYGIKLMEYAENKDITPVFSAIPMLISGMLGAGVVLTKKKCLVACYTISSSIVLMLSIHMNYRFMVKEYSLLPLYKTQCQTEFHTKTQHFCQRYTGTIMLCCVAVSMVPVAVGAVFACLVAHHALKTKNLYLPWFTFSKVEPAAVNRKSRNQPGNNNKMITQVNYTQSRERVVGVIPDFMELAIPSPNDPAYKVLMTNKFGVEIKNAYSKSLNDLEMSLQERFYLKDEEKSFSNDCLIKKNKLSGFKGKTRIHEQCLVSSNVDIRFADEDFVNQKRENKKQKEEYYDSSAEDWIQKVVDNAHNSRSRLYGVSTEESSDSDNELTTNSARRPFLNKQTTTTESRLKDIQGLGIGNGSSYASMPLLETKENIIESDVGLSRDTASPQNDKEISSLSQEKNHYIEFSKRKRADCVPISSGSRDPELDKNIYQKCDRTPIVSSEVVEMFSKEDTPPGLITPLAGCSSPGGQLHFHFEQVPSDNSTNDVQIDMLRAATWHTRKYWIEFEGEENKKKLIEGTISENEYKDLTSNVM